MNFVSLLLLLVVRSFLLVIPIAVAWLAIRRLILSETQNAWLYAAVGLLSVFTAFGLLPWAVGLGQVNWLFFVIAAFLPALWMGILVICTPFSRAPYDAPDYFDAHEDSEDPAPLVLEKPEWPDAPVATFKHRAPQTNKAEPEDNAPRSVLAVARDMRGRRTSEPRRGPALLPPPNSPVPDLPFVR